MAKNKTNSLNQGAGLTPRALSAFLMVLLACWPILSFSKPELIQGGGHEEEFAEFNIGLEPSFSEAVRITRAMYIKGQTQQALGLKVTSPHSAEAWINYYASAGLDRNKFIVIPSPTSLPGPFTIGISHNSAGVLEDWETTLVKAGGQKTLVSIDTIQMY